GELVGVPKDVALSAPDLAEFLPREGITALFLTAALFNQIADMRPDAFASVRYLLVGGEALNARRLRTVLASRPPWQLLNGYGPTETTTFAATYHIRSVPPGAISAPIGRPIANTDAYVLDSSM